MLAVLEPMQNKKPSPFVFQARKSIDHDQEWVTASWTAPQRWSGDRENRASRSRAVGALVFLRPLDMSELNRTVGVTKPWTHPWVQERIRGPASVAAQSEQIASPARYLPRLPRAASPNSIASFHGVFRSQPRAGALCRRKGSGAALRPRSGLAVRMRKLREPLRLAHSLNRALQ